MNSIQSPNINIKDVKQDIRNMLWSMKLCFKRRFFHQEFWEKETRDAEYASLIEGFPRLETVAEHSWLVADTVLLLAPHFPSLDLGRCLKLAVLHDKMEITTEDKNPVGRRRDGTSTHAFNKAKQREKALAEINAIDMYILKLRPSLREEQRADLLEGLEGLSQEALFVKAVDKLQALAFVILKKKGNVDDRHITFTLKYSAKAVTYYPELNLHYQELRLLFLKTIARRRKITINQLVILFESYNQQLELPGIIK
jgi:5'-deoxynucleotidase YfbR-like HD superfamily hydrolase